MYLISFGSSDTDAEMKSDGDSFDRTSRQRSSTTDDELQSDAHEDEDDGTKRETLLDYPDVSFRGCEYSNRL